MREIKFRAWDGKKMWAFESESNHHGYIAIGGNTWGIWINEKLVFQSREENAELIQFTGLKDKTGKEIYEGDIVKYDLYGGEEFPISIVKLNEHMDYGAIWALEKEVIGNIYENPELLEETKK